MTNFDSMAHAGSEAVIDFYTLPVSNGDAQQRAGVARAS